MADKKEKSTAPEGWEISHAVPAKVAEVNAPAGSAEVTLTSAVWVAEKTQDGHLITAYGSTEEELNAAIEAQQASLDNAPASSSAPAPENDEAGNDNEGMASALPETAPQTEEAAPKKAAKEEE